jgi:hypothetical protein
MGWGVNHRHDSEGTDEIVGRSRDLWWAKCHWKRFLRTHRFFLVSYFLQMLYTHSLITLTLLNLSNLNGQHVSTIQKAIIGEKLKYQNKTYRVNYINSLFVAVDIDETSFYKLHTMK